jgi:hypothetical protein
MKFKKILNKFSLQKNFYSGEEFMAIDHWVVNNVLKMDLHVTYMYCITVRCNKWILQGEVRK